MKAYVITTGTVFGLIALAHVWRLFVEGAHVATDVSFVRLTVVCAALSSWPWVLLARSKRS